jgi:hypothetical protein
MGYNISETERRAIMSSKNNRRKSSPKSSKISKEDELLLQKKNDGLNLKRSAGRELPSRRSLLKRNNKTLTDIYGTS